MIINTEPNKWLDKIHNAPLEMIYNILLAEEATIYVHKSNKTLVNM